MIYNTRGCTVWQEQLFLECFLFCCTDHNSRVRLHDSKHKDGSYYYFTRCPLNDFARKYGFLEVSELSLSGYEGDAPSTKMRS